MAEARSTPASAARVKTEGNVATQLFNFFRDIQDNDRSDTLFSSMGLHSDKSEEPKLRKILSKLGQDPSELSTHCEAVNGQTPLHMAVTTNRLWAVDQLLKAGAPVDVADYDGRQPLHIACGKGNTKIIESLLNAKANINAASFDGVTPLGEACKRRQRDVAGLLLDREADVRVIEEDQRSPIQTAVGYGYTEIIDLFLQKRPGIVDATNYNGQTPLHLASCHESPTMVDFLLKNGARPAIEDLEGKLPLHYACEHSNAAVVQRLLMAADAKTRIDAKDHRGWTALHFGAAKGNKEICEVLLSNKAEIDIVDNYHRTALVVAIQRNPTNTLSVIDSETQSVGWRESGSSLANYGHFEVFEFLLGKSAKVDIKDKNGNTALHIAANQGDSDETRMILDKMSAEQQSLRNNDGKTALALAFQRPRSDDIMRTMLEKLKVADFGQHGGEEVGEGQALFWAAESHERHVMVVLILRKGKSFKNMPLPPGWEEWSPVEWVAFREMPLLLWVLLNASPDGKTEEGRKAALQRIKKSLIRTRNQTGGDAVIGINQNKCDTETQTIGSKSSQVSPKQLVRDILRDPNIFQPNSLPKSTSRRKESLKPPVAGRKQPTALSDMEAAVVEFYELPETSDKCNTSALLRRFRPVKDVIYNDGPVKIMEEAKGALGGIFEKEALASSNEFTESRQLYERCNEQPPIFRWVHLPATNIQWMNDLLQRIMVDEKAKDEQFHNTSSFFKNSWTQIPDRTSPSRMMRPKCVSNETSPVASDEPPTAVDESSKVASRAQKAARKNKKKSEASKSSKRAPVGLSGCHTTGEDERRLRALYMPYLAFSEYIRESPKKGVVESQKKVSDEQIKKLHELTKAKKAYNDLLKDYRETAIHGSPTLDEWYYHFAQEKLLEEQQFRNETQVVTKKLYDDVASRDFWTLLRVNQLWIWVIGDEWLISAATHPIDHSEIPLLTELLDYVSRPVESGGEQAQPKSPIEMSKVMVKYCIGSYERDTRYNKDETPRRMFSDSVNEIGVSESTLFQKFKDRTKRGQNRASGYPGRRKTYEAIQEIETTIAEAAGLSCGIKDIRDELKILLTVAGYQKTVQTDLGVVPSERSAEYIVKDLQEMDATAEQIQKAVETLLSLEESEIANLQAMEGIRQGNLLMAFTVATVIFVPLSFVTSLFALDVASFLSSPHWAYWIIGIAFIVTSVFAYCAWSEHVTRLLQGLPSFTKFRDNHGKKIEVPGSVSTGYRIHGFSSFRQCLRKRSRHRSMDPERG